MARYDVTPILNLKKTRRGEREWSENERENWDKIDQFAQVVLSSPIDGAHQPVFNNTYTSLSVIGSIDPVTIEYLYNSSGDIIESIEHYRNNIPDKKIQYIYNDNVGLLDTDINKLKLVGTLKMTISWFNGIKTITRFVYDELTGFLKHISSEEEVIE